MNIAQCLTSTSPIENLTLASLHFRYSPILSSPSQSPGNRPWAFSHSFTENRVEDNDFQSNAAVGAARWNTKDSGFSLTGLGIRYLDSAVRSEGKILSKSHEELLGPFNYNRRHRGTPRLDSCYTTVDDDQKKLSERALVEEDPVQLSPWTFSSMLKATEFTAEDPVYEVSTSLLTENIECSPISNSNEECSLEKLSLVSGLSVELLAAQISATAEYTLQRLAAKEGARLPTLDLDVGEASSATFGMRNFFKAVPPCIGINPSEIMPPPSHFAHPSSISNASCSENLDVPPSLCDQDLLTYHDAAPRSEDALIESKLTSKEELDQLEIAEDKAEALHKLSSASEYSPISDISSRPSARMLRGKKRKLSKKRTDVPQLSPTFQHVLQIDEQGFPPINFGTPVFDAHRGIHLTDLKARAERYRLRNQGRDYDKKWLMSFAGKLTSRGALIEEFRCYVTDCQQRNKRRDHILIHVGGHLDQRPFKCLHWCVLHLSRSYLS